MPSCMPCKRQLHKACKGGCDCTHDSTISSDGPGESSQNDDISPDRGNTRYRRADALKDQQSTGRKRAAELYPFVCQSCGGSRSTHRSLPKCECDAFSPAACEWRGQSNCGGGAVPILGCTNGFQTDRHHGPDKAVTNNENGNVHRICAFCHHAWHDRNNKTYDWTNTVFHSHAPRPMTFEEELNARIEDQMRADRKLKRIKD